MAAKQTVVQNSDGSTTIYVKPDIIGIFGEIVGCAGGLVAAAFVGVKVAEAIGPVSTTVEKVGKAVAVSSFSLATEYYVSEGISGTFNDISELSDWGADKIRERSQKILAQAAAEQVQTVEKQETKKK